MIRRTTLIATLALVALPSLPAAAGGQIVRGRVVEQSTGAPIAGAVVTMLDGAQRRLTSALSADEGQFAVTAPGPGDFVLEVKRIGVKRVTVPVTLAAGATREMDVTVATIPIVQPEVRVSGHSQCGRRPVDGAELAEVWDDLSAALTAARLTEQQRLLRVRVVRYVRRLDARAERVVAEESRREDEGFTVSPFVAISPARLSRFGWVDAPDSTNFIYHGPDAAVLTSDEFVTDHCFSLVKGEDAARGWIGVAFEPVPRRRVADVEGVIWLDQATRELRRVDFTYTTHRKLRGRNALGGRVEFARMPQGSWVARRWRIRMPRIQLELPGTVIPGQRREREPRIAYVVEEGGEVTSASYRGKPVPLGSESSPQ